MLDTSFELRCWKKKGLKMSEDCFIKVGESLDIRNIP